VIKKLQLEYEHVHFERATDPAIGAVWWCYTPDKKLSLGEVMWSTEETDYVYYQPYEAILTEDQLKDIAWFIHKVRPRWI
jgi:hypothetical protein